MKNKKSARSRVSFEYIKSNFFRVVHVDGIHGGVSSDLDIHMAVFTERPPIPKEVVHFVSADGRLEEEDRPARKSRHGFIREVDADIVFDINTARAVIGWLQEKVDEADKIKQKKQIHKD
jgi:hypothetical protein